MKDRIQRIMDDKSMSASKLADLLQVQPSGISHILSGRNKPSMDFIVKFLNVFPEVSPEWFILANGPVYRSLKSEMIPKQSGTDMASIDYETVELKATGKGDGTMLSDLSSHYINNTEKQGLCNNGKLRNNAHVAANTTHTLGLDHPQTFSAPATPKHITRVMVFYSDHTVESFEYCDSL